MRPHVGQFRHQPQSDTNHPFAIVYRIIVFEVAEHCDIVARIRIDVSIVSVPVAGLRYEDSAVAVGCEEMSDRLSVFGGQFYADLQPTLGL